MCSSDLFQIFALRPDEQGRDGADGLAENAELMRLLSRSVDEMELSARAANCLKAAKISTVGQLVAYAEGEMLKFQNFGKKSLDEIKAILETMGLSLGMRIAGVNRPDDPDASEAETGEETELSEEGEYSDDDDLENLDEDE